MKIYKKLMGLQYHMMVNPKTTALPLLSFKTYHRIWNLVYSSRNKY